MLIAAAAWLLALTGGGALYVSFSAQYAYLHAVRRQDAASVIEALLLDLGMIVFSLLALGLSRAGQPARFWYDQPEAEFVLLLQGAARLRFADEAQDRSLGPGDWVEIAANRRHLITRTDPEGPTVWLAVFYG